VPVPVPVPVLGPVRRLPLVPQEES